MTLYCIFINIAPLTLDEMQSLAEIHFSNIRMNTFSLNQKKPYGEQITVERAFNHDNLGKFIWYSKTPPGESLDIIFYCSEFIRSSYSKPEDYISYMLKYSGDGSLLSYLKQNRLAVSVDIGTVWKSSHFSLYGISIVLTEKGFRQVKKVVEISFQYIDLIRRQDPSEEIYKEIQKISESEFL